MGFFIYNHDLLIMILATSIVQAVVWRRTVKVNLVIALGTRAVCHGQETLRLIDSRIECQRPLGHVSFWTSVSRESWQVLSQALLYKSNVLCSHAAAGWPLC